MLGTGLGLLLVEIALRAAGWPAPGYYIGDEGPITERWHYPGRHGGMYPPGVGRLKHYYYDVEMAINEHGLRERPWTPKQSGRWRVGLFGDSYVLGTGVEQPERFGDAWYALVQDRFPNVELWNFGSALCGTKGSADMLDGIARRYDLDEIVLAFYAGNDLLDTYQDVRRGDSLQAPRTRWRAVKYWLRTHCRLISFVWVAVARTWARFEPIGVFTRAELEEYWHDTEAALDRIKMLSGTRPLALLYLPTNLEWDDVAWQQARKRFGYSEDGRWLVKRRLADWAKQQNVELIDVTPWLRQCGLPADCCIPVDGHWNARGHHVVAEGLARHAWSRRPHP